MQTDWFDTTRPGKLPNNLTAVQPPTKGAAKYLWIYLRRPANPMLPPSVATILPGQPGYNPMVVVDSMRFPYIESGGTGKNGIGAGTDTATPGINQIFSAKHYQPFRGGHAVASPPVPAGAAVPATQSLIVSAYGYSEQMVAAPNFSNSYAVGGYSIIRLTRFPKPFARFAL